MLLNLQADGRHLIARAARDGIRRPSVGRMIAAAETMFGHKALVSLGRDLHGGGYQVTVG